MSHGSQVARESPGTQRGQPDDAGLIAESCRVPERFGVVFDRHATAIHGYIARRLGRDAADDLVAETFLVAFRQRGRYDPDQPSARPWLYGIATRLVSRRRRDEVRFFRPSPAPGSTRRPTPRPNRSLTRVSGGRTPGRCTASSRGRWRGWPRPTGTRSCWSPTGSLTPRRRRHWACRLERCPPGWPGPAANSARGSAASTPPVRVRSKDMDEMTLLEDFRATVAPPDEKH